MRFVRHPGKNRTKLHGAAGIDGDRWPRRLANPENTVIGIPCLKENFPYTVEDLLKQRGADCGPPPVQTITDLNTRILRRLAKARL